MARKSRMDGIQSRPSRRGVLSYRATAYVNGVRRGPSPWTLDVEEAIRWRERIVREGQMGLLAGKQVTLGDAIDDFIAGITGGWIRSKTGKPYAQSAVRLYRRQLAQAREHFGDAFIVDTMRVPDVAGYKAKLLRDGAGDSVVHNRITALRAMYRWARHEGAAVVDPCDGIPLAIGDRRVRNIATVERCSLLMTALVGRDRTVFALAWLAGLRVGEILAFAWPDNDLPMRVNVADLESQLLCVTTAVDTITRDWNDRTKSYAGERDVMIRERLAAVLEDHAAQYGTSGLLFPADRVRKPRLRSQTPMAYSSVEQRLAKRWAASGLEPLDLHEGRHTFASMLIANGARDDEVKEQMGHSSITVTKDLYGHLFKRDRDSLRERMNRYDRGEA